MAIHPFSEKGWTHWYHKAPATVILTNGKTWSQAACQIQRAQKRTFDLCGRDRARRSGCVGQHHSVVELASVHLGLGRRGGLAIGSFATLCMECRVWHPSCDQASGTVRALGGGREGRWKALIEQGNQVTLSDQQADNTQELFVITANSPSIVVPPQ